jgi:hypothetical protein
MLTLSQAIVLDKLNARIHRTTGLNFQITNIDGRRGDKGSLVLDLQKDVHFIDPQSGLMQTPRRTPAELHKFFQKTMLDIAEFWLQPGTAPTLLTTGVLGYGDPALIIEMENMGLYLIDLTDYLDAKHLPGIGQILATTKDLVDLSQPDNRVRKIVDKAKPIILADLGIIGPMKVFQADGRLVAAIVSGRGQQIGPKVARHLTIPLEVKHILNPILETGADVAKGFGIEVAFSVGVNVLKLILEDLAFEEFMRNIEWDFLKMTGAAAIAVWILRGLGWLLAGSTTEFTGGLSFILIGSAVGYGAGRLDAATGGHERYRKTINLLLREIEKTGNNNVELIDPQI